MADFKILLKYIFILPFDKTAKVATSLVVLGWNEPIQAIDEGEDEIEGEGVFKYNSMLCIILSKTVNPLLLRSALPLVLAKKLLSYEKLVGSPSLLWGIRAVWRTFLPHCGYRAARKDQR